MDKNEMLPCPFCGAAGHIILVPDTKRFRPQCSGCCVSFGEFNLRKHAEWAWNTRTHHAEIEAMEKESQESHDLIEKLSDILTRTANALKGNPAPLHSHSWHDLPEVAEAMARNAERYQWLRDKSKPELSTFYLSDLTEKLLLPVPLTP